MKHLLIIALALLAGCKTAPVQPPVPVVVQAVQGPADRKADTLADSQASKAAASVQGAIRANASNPEGAPKATTAGELSVAAANLPAPTPADLAASLERVNAGLRGDLKTAQDGWRKAEVDAQKLSHEIALADQAAQRERDENAAKLNARESEWTAAFARLKADADERVKQAQAQAEAEMKRLIGYFFFGGAALCILAGVACLSLFSSMAFVGPKVIAGCFIAGGALAGTGVLLIRALNSPWIGRGVGIAAVVGLIVFALAYANHKHAEATQTP